MLDSLYSNKFEEYYLTRVSKELWLPLPVRLFILGAISLGCHFYYRIKGAYSDPEEKIYNYILASKLEKQKVAIVTGANTGIGFETAKALGKAGYKVIVACRNQAKAESAISKILNDNPDSCLEFLELDLSSFNSVRQFANQFNAKYIQLDLLVNNAGIMLLPEFQLSEDGHEMQYQVNYLSTVLLIRLLLDKLRAADHAKIINLSSLAHYGAGLCNFSAIDNKSMYSSLGNYCLSKAALVMMTCFLQRKLSNENIEVYAVHPGMVQTELFRYRRFMFVVAKLFGNFVIKTAVEGALTVIWLALSPREKIPYVVDSTIYFSDNMSMSPLAWTKEETKQLALWDETSKCLCFDSSL